MRHRPLLPLLLAALLAAAEPAGLPDLGWADAFLQGADAGELRLAVDASRVPLGEMVHARCRVPASIGQAPAVLRYPRWVPGIHAPAGPVWNLGWLSFADQRGALDWRRDPTDPWRFHVDAPRPGTGDGGIIARLGYIANQPSAHSLGVDVLAGRDHLVLNWSDLLLYPEGRAVDAIPCRVLLRLPAGWQVGCALPHEVDETGLRSFAPHDLAELVDSPLLAGRHLRRHELVAAGGDQPPVLLHEVGVAPDDGLDAAWLAALGRLPGEACALFGGAWYDGYHFLLLLGGEPIGLEHAACSLNGLGRGDRELASAASWARCLLPHEYVHSWCGKHRRPLGMLTPDYHTPKDLDGLWVYEGLTQYLGTVLAVRCGLLSAGEWRRMVADLFGHHDTQPGRHWRSLRDCCRSSYLLRAPSGHHGGWRRSQDYYTEGALFWLEVDLRLRLAGVTEGLDAFCRAFLGPRDGREQAWTEAQLCAALAALDPDTDWTALIAERIDGRPDRLPSTMLQQAGWLPTDEIPPEAGVEADLLAQLDDADLAMLGLRVDAAGRVEVQRRGLAERAGITDQDLVVTIAGVAPGEDAQALLRAVIASPRSGGIALRLRRAEVERTVQLPWDQGLRLMHLRRLPERADLLAALLAPRLTGAATEPARPASAVERAAPEPAPLP